jgi:sulfite exporter TauE/SafE
MNLSRLLNTICIILGGAVAIYAQAEEKQNTYFLIGGIVLLVFGVYRTSRNIPSKFDNSQEETFVETEKDKDGY